MSDALVKPQPEEAAPITTEEASAAMLALGIRVRTSDVDNYKKVGSWLVQQDINAVKLAQSFDSDDQIKLAIEVSRELVQHGDPDIRVKGVQSLLAAVKARVQVSTQTMKLAEAVGGVRKGGGRNLPPVFRGEIYVSVNAPAPTEVKAVDI